MTSPWPHPTTEELATLTPSEVEERYRQEIDTYTRLVDHHYFEDAWGSTNLEIRKHGFAKRDGMSEEEYVQLWKWLQRRWPLQPLTEEDAG